MLPLPLCLDELIDWTEEATALHALFNCRRSHENESCQISTDFIDAVVFIPLFRDAKKSYLASLPSLSRRDRESYLSENVVIKVTYLAPRKTILYLALREFCKIFSLLRRLGELIGTEETLSGIGLAKLTQGPHDDCVICFSSISNTILGCGHALCESCEKRWVLKQLKCPFCLARYDNSKQAKSKGWHLLEWSFLSQHVEEDVLLLESALSKVWDRNNESQCLKNWQEFDSFRQISREIFLQEAPWITVDKQKSKLCGDR
jgi:hypothetical protein